MSTYTVTARNFSETSENRIHSDEIAKKFGFRGALVPGVAVYGHLTHLPVKTFGPRWLEHSVADVRLRSPAYHGEEITMNMAANGDGHQVICTGPTGETLAELNTAMPESLPAAEDPAILDGPFRPRERTEISWDAINVLEPFEPWSVELKQDANERFTMEVAESLPLYAQEGYIHPHYLLALANIALVREYIMPAWIHVGSETRHRSALRVGDEIQIRSVPMEKWERKGHEFIRLYISYWRGDELTTDIVHTAIYKVAQ